MGVFNGRNADIRVFVNQPGCLDVERLEHRRRRQPIFSSREYSFGYGEILHRGLYEKLRCRRTEYLDRLIVADAEGPRCPDISHQRRQSSVMIEMMMCNENSVDGAGAEACQHQLT